ncbi:cell division protein ZapB [Salinispira pacifica]
MVNLEQIRLLESRVQKAVQNIQKLREENRSLRASLSKYEQRIGDLEGMVGEFKTGQDEIEQSITSALKQLDRLEDELLEEPDAGATGSPGNTAPAGKSQDGGARAGHPERSSDVEPSAVRTEHGKRSATAGNRQSDDDFVAEPVKPEDGDPAGGDNPQKDADAESELDIF